MSMNSPGCGFQSLSVMLTVALSPAATVQASSSMRIRSPSEVINVSTARRSSCSDATKLHCPIDPERDVRPNSSNAFWMKSHDAEASGYVLATM